VSVNVEAIRERLARERKDVADELARLRAELGISIEDSIEEYGVDSHLGDSATETFERELDVTVVDNQQELLRQYDEALERLAAGSYGRCVVCGKEIDPERLDGLPYTAYCIDDARKRELG
jgi:RNA polymerase-binding transcription factor DksA